MHALDNAIWTALTTKQAQLAHSAALARRFPPEMTLLGALAANTAMAFDSLAQLIQRDAVTLYFPSAPNLPKGWEVVRAVELQQMVQETEAPAPAGPDRETLNRETLSQAAPKIVNPKIVEPEIVEPKIGEPEIVEAKIVEPEIVELTQADVPEMSVVYAATRPGRTLCPRIQKLGMFLGIRQEDKLVAMGGLRLHIAGYREITTVATLPGFEGRGYATALMLALVERIRGRGERPFLTVRLDNIRAIEIYRRLGFKERTRLYSQTIRRLQT